MHYIVLDHQFWKQPRGHNDLIPLMFPMIQLARGRQLGEGEKNTRLPQKTTFNIRQFYHNKAERKNRLNSNPHFLIQNYGPRDKSSPTHICK